jgi:hypothetical protein
MCNSFVFCLWNWIGCMICMKLFYLWIGPQLCGSWSPWAKKEEGKMKKNTEEGAGGCMGADGTRCICVFCSIDCRWLFFFSCSIDCRWLFSFLFFPIIILKSRNIRIPFICHWRAGGRWKEQTRKNPQNLRILTLAKLSRLPPPPLFQLYYQILKTLRIFF